jgi:hypothetical protein
MANRIYDLVKAQELTSYWETLVQDREPYLGEELFPAQKKLGLELKWIKGAKGLPVVLKPSAYDVTAVPRTRIAFDTVSTEMPFFKESMYIDEVTRQELNMVMETGNQAYIDAVINKVFDDNTQLLEGASAQRERMRMMALTTGAISIAANGQAYTYDYGVVSGHKPTADASWATATTDIVSDIRTWQDLIEGETGVRPSRAVISRKTWGYFRANTMIRNAVLGNNTAVMVSDVAIRSYLLDNLGLDVVIYSKRYKNEAGLAAAYVPDDTFIMFPAGALGNTWFGTTPEESDLIGNGVANVSLTDVGVAVTTMEKADPVNVETKVTMICLPSFEAADQIIIADIIP